MNYNTQTNVPRKKVVSSQEKTSNRRDVLKKMNNQTLNELSNSKLKVDSLKDNNEKLSTPRLKNTKRSSSKNLLQQDSLESPSASQSKTPRDRPIIDKSVNSSINTRTQQKIVKKSTPVLQKPNVNSVKNKPKKVVNNNDEKRGISTIYMPKNSSLRTRDINEAIKKDRNNKSTVNKNSDKNSNNSKTNTNHQRVPSRERRKSRTLSPSEIKILKTNIKSSELSSDTSKSKTSVQHDSSSDVDYEDDFEDYESDFQECTDSDEPEASQISDESEGINDNDEPEAEPIELQTQKNEKKIITNLPIKKYSEEEHMLDSGHYELQEARRRAARVDLMTANQNTRTPVSSIERPILYSDGKPSEIKSLPSSADEGFEDGRSGDFGKSSLISASQMNQINSKHLDNNSRETQIKPKRRRLTRGKQLLEMINLDVVQWSLYESQPIAYEEFIRIHGKINTRQISTQTNDDNLSVEVQTDEIEYKNMWTQYPISCRNILQNDQDIDLFTAELVGVGSDEYNVEPHPQYDILELNEFVNTAGHIILTLLENKQSQKINLISDTSSIDQLPFTEGKIELSMASVTFLSNRPVTMIRYSDRSSNVLLTIYDRADEDVETSADDDFYITDCCIGCQWNIFEPLQPIKIFYSTNNITACCFHPTNYNIVFGGLEDGSLSLWDLSENETFHRHFIDKENNIEWTLRCVTFNSSANWEKGNQSKIVGLTVFSETETNIADDIGKFMPLQICSLNEDGGCIVWSILKNFEESSINQDLGQSWWGKLRLIKSHDIRIDFTKGMNIENLMRDFRDISVDSINKNNLYIATNVSQVLHVTRFGSKPQPPVYKGPDCIGGTTCIEICPFGQSFFLVGCEDGCVRLHSSKIQTPLLQLRNLNSNASIKNIQWSKSKPLIIYVLDDDATIHVWDLSQSDNSPVCSVTPDKYAHVNSIQLSPWRTDRDMKNQYIAIGLDNGTVEIHKLNQKYYHSHKDNLSLELKMFFDYLGIY